MITQVLIVAVHFGFSPLGPPSPIDAQIRPGTFTGVKADPSRLAEMEAIRLACVRASELELDGDYAGALAALVPWRHVATSDEGAVLYQPFLRAYIQVGDLKGYLALTEERYSALFHSKSTSNRSHDVLRYATALYVNGKEEQAWLLCQRHADLFNENFYDNTLQEYKDRQVTLANLGDALLRASAHLDESLSPYFYSLLVKERPNDAAAYWLLAHSLPFEDLLGRKHNLEKAWQFGDGEMRKAAERELERVKWRIGVRERAGGVVKAGG